jgi:hypothetical protein
MQIESNAEQHRQQQLFREQLNRMVLGLGPPPKQPLVPPQTPPQTPREKTGTSVTLSTSSGNENQAQSDKPAPQSSTKRVHSRSPGAKKESKKLPNGGEATQLRRYLDDWLRANKVRDRVDFYNLVATSIGLAAWDPDVNGKFSSLPSRFHVAARRVFGATKPKYKKCLSIMYGKHKDRGVMWRRCLQRTDFWKSTAPKSKTKESKAEINN